MKHLPPKDCVCGHKWEDHHHGCIMNSDYPSEDHDKGICMGLFPEECEATQINGDWLVKNEADRCYCSRYRPFDKEIEDE